MQLTEGDPEAEVAALRVALCFKDLDFEEFLKTPKSLMIWLHIWRIDVNI